MFNYSEVYRAVIENREISFDEKKELLKNDNNDLFYQLVKYLYSHYRDTAVKAGEDMFHVTVREKVRYRKETKLSGYDLPLPVSEQNGSEAFLRWQEKMTNDCIDRLDECIRKIAEYNIHAQDFPEREGRIPFEKLEGVKQKTGKNRAYKDNGRSRKTMFCKSVLSYGIRSQLTGKGPTRMRLLMLAYALQMTERETVELIQAVDPDASVNIWNGYEMILFYAIARRDMTLADLDELGMFLAGGEDPADPPQENMTDTRAAWNRFTDLVKMKREDSLREMRKLLRNIKAVRKVSSVRRKEELERSFRYVLERAEMLFADSYAGRCRLAEGADESTYRKCRNALTEQFWPYYGNQIQSLEWTDGLKLMKYLPNRKHLKAVDEGKQPVTKADLEFVFFLRFALESPLAGYGKQEEIGFDQMIGKRCSDYRLKIDEYLTDFCFEEVRDMHPFDGLLLVCMQRMYPVKALHELAREYFDIRGSAAVRNL